jgi:hypothetical protein
MSDPSPHTDVIFDQLTMRNRATQIPPPVRRFVSGFPTHSGNVLLLPLTELMLLSVLAEWVMSTHEMPTAPVAKISFIGHSDRDDNVGREFERLLSQTRAEAVRLYFIKELLVKTPIGFVSIVPRISFPPATGVGSAEITPASDEAGRLRNRRVTLVFERGPPPAPPPPFILDLPKVKVAPVMIGPPSPPFIWSRPLPKPIKVPKTKFEEAIDRARRITKFFDVGSMAKGAFNAVREFIDPALTPEERRKAETEVAQDLADEFEKENRERGVRLRDPPGEPDPKDSPPPP